MTTIKVTLRRVRTPPIIVGLNPDLDRRRGLHRLTGQAIDAFQEDVHEQPDT